MIINKTYIVDDGFGTLVKLYKCTNDNGGIEWVKENIKGGLLKITNDEAWNLLNA